MRLFKEQHLIVISRDFHFGIILCVTLDIGQCYYNCDYFIYLFYTVPCNSYTNHLTVPYYKILPQSSLTDMRCHATTETSENITQPQPFPQLLLFINSCYLVKHAASSWIIHCLVCKIFLHLVKLAKLKTFSMTNYEAWCNKQDFEIYFPSLNAENVWSSLKFLIVKLPHFPLCNSQHIDSQFSGDVIWNYCPFWHVSQKRGKTHDLLDYFWKIFKFLVLNWANYFISSQTFLSSVNEQTTVSTSKSTSA